MKFALALLLAAACVAATAAAPGGTQVAVDAPPPKDIHRKTPPGAPSRGKRAATCGTPTKLNAAQAEESIKAHNLFRSREPATNMLKVKWNDEMASVAQAWADKCLWEHGMLYDCAGNRIGQNLFVEASAGGYPTMNLTYSIEAWNNERNDFNWDTQKCTPGKLCGHWTQLAGAKSNEVGCAYNLCPTMTVAGSVWKNALYIVCDYTPPGNVIGEPIYLKGSTCSNCASVITGQGSKCESNMCVPCSPATDAACKCPSTLACVNGGSWSASTCTCTCPKGFFGLTCEYSCANADTTADCSAYAPYCTNEDYKDFMMENCKSTCKFLPASCSA